MSNAESHPDFEPEDLCADVGPEASSQVTKLQLRVAELERMLASSRTDGQIQTALYRIADIANSPEDTSTFYAELHSTIAGLVEVENFYIAVYHPADDTMSFPYYVDQHDSEQSTEGPINNPTRRYPLSSFPDSPTGLVFRSGVLQHFCRDQLSARAIASGTKPIDARGKMCEDWVGVPLTRGSQVFGVLAIQSYTPGFRYGDETKALLTYLSQHIASALQWRRDADSVREAHLQLKTANQDLRRQADEILAANTRLQAMLEERQRTEIQLVHNSLHDDLTGLPNRTLLTNRLQTLIDLSRDPEREPINYYLLFLDLDGFKLVNDSLGHLIGDELLIQVGERLVRSCRKSDIVARLGGDEFCILMDERASYEDAASVAQRIFAELSAPFHHGEQQIFVSTSIGIAISNPRYATPEQLIRDADAAMYEAKASGRSQYRTFDQSMHKSAVDRLQLESRLRQAVAKQQVTVAFQPIYDLSSGRIASFEALARWHDERLGEVPPSQFIQAAEEIGAIRELGMQLLAQAARQVGVWRRQFGLDLNVNINVSCRQIDDPDFFETALNMVDAVKLPRPNLCLEITETSLLENTSKSAAVLEKLRNAAVNLSLDDFGTGYSSLAYVHRLPMTQLKIDNSFISSIDKDERSAALVELIQSLSHTMQLDSVAEGIESEEQLQMVIAKGIRFGQGYHLGEPMSAQDAEALLAKQPSDCQMTEKQ